MVLNREKGVEVRGVKAVYKLLGSIMALALITLSLLPATTLTWAAEIQASEQTWPNPSVNMTVLRSQAILLKIMIERTYRSLNASSIPEDLRSKAEELISVSTEKINSMTVDQLEKLVSEEKTVYHELTSILEKTTPSNVTITVIKTIVNQVITSLNKTLSTHYKELVHELYINITKVIETRNAVKIISIVKEVDNIAKIMHVQKFADTVETMTLQAVNTTMKTKSLEEAYKLMIKALHELNRTVDILRMIKKSLPANNMTKEISVSIDLALTHVSQALKLIEQTIPIIKIYVETNMTANATAVKEAVKKTANVTLQEIMEKLRSLNQTLARLREDAIKTNNTRLYELVNKTMEQYKIMVRLAMRAEEMIENGNLTGALKIMAEIKTMLHGAWGMIEKNASKYMAEDIIEKLKELKTKIEKAEEHLSKVAEEAEKCGCNDALNMTKQAMKMLEEARKLYAELEKMAKNGGVNVTVAVQIINKIDSIIIQVNITISTAEGVIETVKKVKIDIENQINKTIAMLREYNETLAKLMHVAEKINATQAEKVIAELNKTLQQALKMVKEANKTLQQGNITDAAKILNMVKGMIKKIQKKMEEVKKMIRDVEEKVKQELEKIIRSMREDINKTMTRIDKLYSEAEKLNVTDAMKLLNKSRELLVNASKLLDNAEKLLKENKTVDAIICVGEAKLKIMEAKMLVEEAEKLIKAAEEKAKAQLEIEIKTLKAKIYQDNKTLSLLKIKAEREKNETALKMIEEAYKLLGNATQLLNKAEEKLKQDDVAAAQQLVGQARQLLEQAEKIIKELSSSM